MHSFRSSYGRLLEMTISLSNSPRSSLTFTSFPPAFISIMAFEVLNVLSIFVILSHTQSHPSVKCSVANFTNMRCPISSHTDMPSDTFFSHNFHYEKVVNLDLIFSCQGWITEHICKCPGIRHHSRESLCCHGVVLFCRCFHCRTYFAANSCSTLDSSGAMMKNLSSAFSFWVIPTIPPITFSGNGLWPVRIIMVA